MVEVGIIVALTLKGTYIGDYDKLREIAQESEKIGIHSLWHCDHFVTLDPASYGSQTGFGSTEEKEQSADTAILEPWTTLAALARDTESLRLGTLVTCVGYRPPAMLAKTAATVDVISKGRVDFGIGAGWIENEYHSFGYPYPNAAVRIEQLEEAIRLIRAMWTESAPLFRWRIFSDTKRRLRSALLFKNRTRQSGREARVQNYWGFLPARRMATTAAGGRLSSFWRIDPPLRPSAKERGETPMR